MADEHEHQDPASDPGSDPGSPGGEAGPAASDEHTQMRAALDRIEGDLDAAAATIARMS